jgi:polyhydroxybutyrate depolymerase
MIKKLSQLKMPIFVVILIVFMSGIALAEDVEGGFLHDGTYRTYLLHIPPSYNGEDSIPLVINMNGGGREGEAYASMTQTSQKADEEGFFVVYPSHLTGVPWNAGEWYDSDVDDVGFISCLIDTLGSEYTIDTSRIYATGFSTGALMTHRLACELSARIAAAAPVAGPLILDACQPARPVPIMHIHARDDHHVPYYGGKGIYEPYSWPSVDSSMGRWVELNECSIGPDSFYNEAGALRQRWINVDSSCEVVLWTTEDGKHTWPGSSLIDPILGLPSQAISANDEIWEFFVAHPMPVEEDEPDIQEPIATPFFSLDPASPSIFSESAVIRFSIDRNEKVVLKLFDALGREIATLVDCQLGAGQHEVVIDAGGLSAGVYFYRLNTPTFTKTQSIRLIN